MNAEEQLRRWFIELSGMIDGNLSEEATLGDGLEWFGSLPDVSLAELQALGKNDSSVGEFLQLGRLLIAQVNR